MNYDFEKFYQLKSKNAAKVMLKSSEARGGYMHKTENVSNKRLHQVTFPKTKQGYLETYCEEY